MIGSKNFEEKYVNAAKEKIAHGVRTL